MLLLIFTVPRRCIVDRIYTAALTLVPADSPTNRERKVDAVNVRYDTIRPNTSFAHQES